MPALIISRLFVKSKKIGLALSGGAARGMAHLGVVKALYEKDIRIGCIAGTSSGAIAGAFIADGYDPEEILEIVMKKKIITYLRFALAKPGLLTMIRIRKILEQHLRARRFEDLKIPLYVTCTNLNSGQAEYFHEGEIIDKIIASSSIPGLFAPVEINGSIYADGGILDNLPVKAIKDKCKRVIGVDVNYTGPEEKIVSAIAVIERSFHLSIRAKVEEKAKLCDLFIDPDELRDYGLTDLGRGREMFDIGYRKAMELLEETKVLN